MNRPLSFIDKGDGYAKVICACGWESARFLKSPFDPMESLIGFQTEHMTCIETPPMVPPARTFYAIGQEVHGKFLLLSDLLEGPDAKERATELAKGLAQKGLTKQVLEIKVIESWVG